MKQEHNYLQGFINQFEEEGEHQELLVIYKEERDL